MIAGYVLKHKLPNPGSSKLGQSILTLVAEEREVTAELTTTARRGLQGALAASGDATVEVPSVRQYRSSNKEKLLVRQQTQSQRIKRVATVLDKAALPLRDRAILPWKVELPTPLPAPAEAVDIDGDVEALAGNVNNNLLSTVAAKLLKFGDGAVHAPQLLQRYAAFLENGVAKEFMERCMTVCAHAFEKTGVLAAEGAVQYTVGGKAWGDRIQYSYRSIREQLVDAGPRLKLLHSVLTQSGVQAVDVLPSQAEVLVDSTLSLYLATAAFEYAMENVLALAAHRADVYTQGRSKNAAINVPTTTGAASVTGRSARGRRVVPVTEAGSGARGAVPYATEQTYERIPIDAGEINVGSLVMGYWNDEWKWCRATVTTIHVDTTGRQNLFRLRYEDDEQQDVGISLIGARALEGLAPSTSPAVELAVCSSGIEGSRGTTTQRGVVAKRSAAVKRPRAAEVEVAAKERAVTEQLHVAIVASVKRGGQWNSIIVLNIRYKCGWIVHKLLKQVERQGTTVAKLKPMDAQVLQLLLWLDTSAGRAVGTGHGFGPGTSLVSVRDVFVQFMLRLEWYFQLEVLTPACVVKYKADVFNHAVVALSESTDVRNMWNMVVGQANRWSTVPADDDGMVDEGYIAVEEAGERHVVGAEASVLVLEKVVRAAILSKQKGMRHVLHLAPDHSRQDALRTDLKHSQNPLCTKSLQHVSQLTRVPVGKINAMLLAAAVSGGGSSEGARQLCGEPGHAMLQQVTAMAGCSTTGRGAQGGITDADVALQSMYTWTMYELGADGVTFARLQCANGDMRCIVNTVPAQSPRPSKAVAPSEVTSVHGVQPGDVVLQVLQLASSGSKRGSKSGAVVLKEHNPLAFLVRPVNGENTAVEQSSFPVLLTMKTSGAFFMDTLASVA